MKPVLSPALKQRVVSVDPKDAASRAGYVFALRGDLVRVVFDDHSIRDVERTQLRPEFKVGDQVRTRCCTDPVCRRRAARYLVVFTNEDLVAAVPLNGSIPQAGGRLVHINIENWELAD